MLFFICLPSCAHHDLWLRPTGVLTPLPVPLPVPLSYRKYRCCTAKPTTSSPPPRSCAPQRLLDGFARYEVDGAALHGLYMIGRDCSDGMAQLHRQVVQMCGEVAPSTKLKLWGRLAPLFRG